MSWEEQLSGWGIHFELCPAIRRTCPYILPLEFVNITLIFSVPGCKYVTRDVDIREALGLGQIFIVSNPVQYGNHALYHSCICLTWRIDSCDFWISRLMWPLVCNEVLILKVLSVNNQHGSSRGSAAVLFSTHFWGLESLPHYNWAPVSLGSSAISADSCWIVKSGKVWPSAYVQPS